MLRYLQLLLGQQSIGQCTFKGDDELQNNFIDLTEALEKEKEKQNQIIASITHDIKTPLTSIINYVDLLKREKLEIEPAKSYIEVLDNKSQRLKQLTDDLVEASKISTGNITLIKNQINLMAFMHTSI